MAKAIKRSVITETVDGFTLDLNLIEARLLLTVLNKVGGKSRNRDIIDTIRQALIDSGLVFANGTPSDYKNEEYFATGSITFN